MKNYKSINEAVKHGYFTEFDKLGEDKKIEIAKTWNEEMQVKYLSRKPSLSEEDVFDTLIAKIKSENNESSIF